MSAWNSFLRLFHEDFDSVARGNEKKLIKHQSRLIARVGFFSSRVVNGWNKLARRAVEIRAVKIFKVDLDRKWNEVLVFLSSRNACVTLDIASPFGTPVEYSRVK